MELKNIVILSAFLSLNAIAGISEDSVNFKSEFNTSIPEKYKVDLDEKQIHYLKTQIMSYNQIKNLEKPEFVLIADRNPSVQSLSIVLTDGKEIEIIGTSKVSTGTTKRKHHYFTPVGIFEHKREYGTYRAEGTKNENGVLGLGKKGMRVFDFGWQKSHAGWGTQYEADIRLQLHATDPNLLEQKLGTTASKGCVRVQSDVNKFIDKYGVLDKNYLEAPAWMISKEKINTNFDGRYMIVVDSGDNKL